jgi:hypothetical protein
MQINFEIEHEIEQTMTRDCATDGTVNMSATEMRI